MTIENTRTSSHRFINSDEPEAVIADAITARIIELLPSCSIYGRPSAGHGGQYVTRIEIPGFRWAVPQITSRHAALLDPAQAQDAEANLRHKILDWATATDVDPLPAPVLGAILRALYGDQPDQYAQAYVRRVAAQLAREEAEDNQTIARGVKCGGAKNARRVAELKGITERAYLALLEPTP